jgi:hypothetical protein
MEIRRSATIPKHNWEEISQGIQSLNPRKEVQVSEEFVVPQVSAFEVKLWY